MDVFRAADELLLFKRLALAVKDQSVPLPLRLLALDWTLHFPARLQGRKREKRENWGRGRREEGGRDGEEGVFEHHVIICTLFWVCCSLCCSVCVL